MSSLRATASPTRENAKGQARRLAHPWLLITMITILGLIVRVAWLGSKSLWTDEAHSLYFATQSVTNIFTNLCDPHPPAYYALLHVFLTVGKSEFWLRLPSAIAGALTIPLLYVLGRDAGSYFSIPWLDRSTALLASLLLAVAPLLVWYAQEARMYALITALGVASVYFALRVAWRGRKRDALGYFVFAIAGLYFDQSSLAPLLLANLLFLGIWVWKKLRDIDVSGWELVKWLGLQLMVGAAFWLWWSQSLFRSTFEAGTLYPLTMVTLVLENIGVTVSLPTLRWLLAVGVTITLVVGTAAVWLSARHHRLRRLGPVLALGVVTLFLLVTVASVIPRIFTVKRLVVSLLPFFLLLSAWAMRSLQLKRWLLAGLVGFSFALCLVNILWIPKEPWREVAAFVQNEIGLDDALWVDELAIPAFDYYYGGSQEPTILRAARLEDLIQASVRSEEGSVAEGRLWIVTVADGYRNVADYLPASWEPASSDEWYHVSVQAYSRAQIAQNSAVIERDLPSWLLDWPSPFHDACQISR
jgi:mannosyltransferase